MIRVSNEEFFAFIGPRNVHPSSDRERTVWRDQGTGNVVAVSKPGYILRDENGRPLPTEYMICGSLKGATGAAGGEA